jgi:ATP-dependent Clp protease ATP-binding subunit ClpA
MAARMFQRYDEDAKLAVYYAALLAAHRRAKFIRTEDLLLGLTWRNHVPDCEFRGLKENALLFWSAAGVPHLPITTEPYKPTKVPLNDAAKRVLAYTKMEADSSKRYWIDVDHMLLGILREGGIAADTLRQSGWTVERIKSAAERGRSIYPQKPEPWIWRHRNLWRWVTIAAILFMVLYVLYMRSQGLPY